MARLIGNNIITAPSNMNSKYWEDYVEAAGHKGDFLNGIGQIGQSLEDAGADYLEYTEKQADKKKAEKRQDLLDEREATRFEREGTEYQQKQDEYANTIEGRKKRKQQIDEFYAGKHDPEYDTIEGRAAADAYINGEINALNVFRSNINTAKALEKQNQETNTEKQNEALLKSYENRLYKEIGGMNLDSLTDTQVKNLDKATRSAYLDKLSELRSEANQNGLRNVVADIDKHLLRLQSGSEKQAEENKANENNAKIKAQAKADADLFG